MLGLKLNKIQETVWGLKSSRVVHCAAGLRRFRVAGAQIQKQPVERWSAGHGWAYVGCKPWQARYPTTVGYPWNAGVDEKQGQAPKTWLNWTNANFGKIISPCHSGRREILAYSVVSCVTLKNNNKIKLSDWDLCSPFNVWLLLGQLH